MFIKRAVLKNFAIITGKHLCLSPFLIITKLQALSSKQLQRRYFPMNVAKYLRTALFIEHLQWLPLNIDTKWVKRGQSILIRKEKGTLSKQLTKAKRSIYLTKTKLFL